MKILPASIEQQISRVDRTPSLIAGISCGLLAFWSFYRVLWMFYIMMTYPNFLFASVVFSIVLWGAIGVVAAIVATGFLTRYFRQPEQRDEQNQS